MQKEISPEKIQNLVYSPVVSDVNTSPEAKLMREAKQIEAQSLADTKYDALVEPFRVSSPLVGVAVALCLLLASVAFRGKLKK